ncbi:MAG: efflux RND transporter permease subunit [Verrucomicrobiae bacterium]|nr:efflux RND transporter permease subunit [Verrucomicrobiae bacterium]
MLLSDTSIRRPVFATVLNLLLVTFGIVSFTRLQVREFPDVDPPIVTISTNYIGASAQVVERRITQLIEDQISIVEAIKSIESSSMDGSSTVTVEFDIERNIDDAANDLREALSGLLDDLPDEADPPEITKEDSATEVMMWLSLTSEYLTPVELADYAERYLVDSFSVLPGVARIRISGASSFALRVWIDRQALAARNLTVSDVEKALQSQNVELPAGTIQSLDRQFTVRIKREFLTEEDFRNLVVFRGENGFLVRLGEVAKIELAAEEARRTYRANGVPRVGLGLIKQSQANTLDVSHAAKDEMKRIRSQLPDGMFLDESYDTSVFIEESLKQVGLTLGIAVILVVAVIYLFLGNARATIIPAVTVPVSLISSFILLNSLGYSVNLLTLLALILAIGLVVDDAIVVLENVYHRIETGEKPLAAAFLGTRQVAFAVIATTVVLVAVFVPISFLEGDLGKLFTEFAITLAVAVCFSSFVALTLSPMLASRLLTAETSRGNWLTRFVDGLFRRFESVYRKVLGGLLKVSLLVILIVGAFLGGSYYFYKTLPSEFTPKEDRGAFFVITSAPEGASFGSISNTMDEVEKRLMYLNEQGEVGTLLIRAPRGFGSNIADFNQGLTIVVLSDWGERRSAWVIMDEVRAKLADVPGVKNFIVMRQGLTRGLQKPVQFVIGGPNYEELASWRDKLLAEVAKNPKMIGVDYDYKETKPQLRVNIDQNRAGDLGVSIQNIGRSLESLLGSRIVTTFIQDGEEYDVIVEGNYDRKRTPSDLTNIQVRSELTGELIPLSSLVTIEEIADSGALNRYNRIRAITLEANLAEGYSLSEALDYLDDAAARVLPDQVIISYKGQSLDYKESGSSAIFVFLLAIIVVFLVLAAQFESFIQPITIMLAVPVAIFGGLYGLWTMGFAQNIYTQIGTIMLIGLAAKNGILIVEFINQLRDQGQDFNSAVLDGSVRRLRPIVMTGLTTVMGSIPLVITSGAGSETRIVIGVVILFGVSFSALFTLFVVPMAYQLIARRTTSPEAHLRRLEEALADTNVENLDSEKAPRSA